MVLAPLAVGLSLASLVLLDVVRFLQLVVNGAVVGSVLALSAVGLTLVYGILRIANFAHGDFLTFGAYLALYFIALLVLPSTITWAVIVAVVIVAFVFVARHAVPRITSRAGRTEPLSILSKREAGGLFAVAALLLVLALAAHLRIGQARMFLGVALAVALVAAFAVIFDLAVWRRARRQGSGVLTLIIISIGLALALRYSIQSLWGGSPRFVPGTFLPAREILGTGILITPNQTLIIVVTLAVIVLLHLFLRYTRTGKSMRALADNPELARITGIDVDRVILYVWIIAGSLAAIAGILYSRLNAFTPEFGWFMLLPIFAAVILGGIGSPYGALIGAFTIGLAMETSVYFGVPTEYRLAVGFGILILVLIIRPSGIMGGAQAR